VPICLPISKLATPMMPHFKHALLSPNSNHIQHIGELCNLYGKIANEWNEATDQGEALYASTEPKLRELILGMEGTRVAKFASFDFDVAVGYADKGDFGMANRYFSYALAKVHKQLDRKKLGYGYDVSGEVQGGGGTSGGGKHLWDTGNSPKHDHTTNNPANMMLDAEAESDYPELAKFKHKRVYWPPRTR
jgi:hypothetical protein